MRVLCQKWLKFVSSFFAMCLTVSLAQSDAKAWEERPVQGITWPQPSSQAQLSAPLAAAASPVRLSSPVGGDTQFGAAIATWSDSAYDYVVVGAPRAPNAQGGTGRAWVYTKRVSDASFGAPVELLQPSGGHQHNNEFGRSVAIDGGQIVVGAPGGRSGAWTSMIYIYSQFRDASGYIVPGSAFHYNFRLGAPVDGGRSVGYSAPLNLVSNCGREECWLQGLSNPGQYITLETAKVYGQQVVVGSSQVAPWAAVAQQSNACASGSQLAFVNWQRWSDPNPGAFNGVQSTNCTPTGSTAIVGLGEYYYMALAGLASPQGGKVLAYDTIGSSPGNLWRQLTNQIPGAGTTLPNGLVPSANFGKQAKTTGDFVIVGDPTAASNAGAVYSFNINRGAAPHNPTNWTFPVSALLGLGGPTFGEAIAGGGELLLIGEPGASAVSIYPSGNVVQSTVTSTSTPQGTVTVTLTKVGTGPDPTVTASEGPSTPECTVFRSGLQASGGIARPICLQVENVPPFLGEAEVCFPNPRRVENFYGYRCTARLACLPNETLRPPANLCCSKLKSTTLVGADPYCVKTSGFSYFLAADDNSLVDSDADGNVDLLDNCPPAFNPMQVDADMDGLGDECDPTPNGEDPKPVPAGPTWAFAAALLAMGTWVALRRRGAN